MEGEICSKNKFCHYRPEIHPEIELYDKLGWMLSFILFCFVFMETYNLISTVFLLLSKMTTKNYMSEFYLLKFDSSYSCHLHFKEIFWHFLFCPPLLLEDVKSTSFLNLNKLAVNNITKSNQTNIDKFNLLSCSDFSNSCETKWVVVKVQNNQTSKKGQKLDWELKNLWQLFGCVLSPMFQNACNMTWRLSILRDVLVPKNYFIT